MRQLILAAMIAAACNTAFAATKTADKANKPAAEKPTGVVVDIKVRDMSVRFMDFFDAASRPMPAPPAALAAPAADGKTAATPAPPVAPAAPLETEADRRWRFFKAAYNFPADQADEAKTRAALDAAWPRYAAIAPKLRTGFDAIATEISDINRTLADEIYLDKPLAIRYIAYVGTFDGRVWSDMDDDRINLYLPLEVAPEVRDLPFARLLGRHMLSRTAVWGNQPRSVVELAINEGVYAHVLQAAVPGKSVDTYLDLTPEQLAKAKAGLKVDMKDMIAKLDDRNPATLAAYSGPQIAQLRYAGWMLVENFVKNKSRLGDLIRQKQDVLIRASQLAMASIIRNN